MIKKILVGLVAILVVLQFVRPAKNISPAVGPQDITTKIAMPADVQRVLAESCYDCHSDNTRYPWYAEVQPVGWWLASHIRDGKRHLNFSEFAAYDAKHAQRKLQQTAHEIEGHTMPLKSYLWIHRDAILTEAEIKLVSDWTETARAQLKPASAPKN